MTPGWLGAIVFALRTQMVQCALWQEQNLFFRGSSSGLSGQLAGSPGLVVHCCRDRAAMGELFGVFGAENFVCEEVLIMPR